MAGASRSKRRAATLISSEAISRNGEFRIQYDLEHQRYRVLTPFGADGRLAMTEEDRLSLAWKDLPSSIKFARITIATGIVTKRELRIVAPHFFDLITTDEANVGDARAGKRAERPVQEAAAMHLGIAFRGVGRGRHQASTAPGSNDNRFHRG